MYISKFTPEEIESLDIAGGWSVNDILAHITAWEQLFLGWYQGGIKGEKVEFPVPGITWAEMDELNDQIYQEHKDKSFETIDMEAKASYKQILETVEGMAEESLFEAGYFSWTGQKSLAYFLRECTELHYVWAWELIHIWLRKNRKTQMRFPIIGILISLLGLFFIYLRDAYMKVAALEIIFIIGKLLSGVLPFTIAVFIVFGVRKLIYKKIIYKNDN